MVRFYKRKALKTDPDILRKAVAAISWGSSVRNAAKTFGTPRTTLILHWKNHESSGARDPTKNQPVKPEDVEIVTKGFQTVLCNVREHCLEKYLLDASEIYENTK